MIIGQIAKWHNTFELRFTVFILDIYTDLNAPTCEQVPLNTNKQ